MKKQSFILSMILGFILFSSCSSDLLNVNNEVPLTKSNYIIKQPLGCTLIAIR